MKTILVLNCGSSSVKYALFRGTKEIVRGFEERVGKGKRTHRLVVDRILKTLISDGHVSSLAALDAVGHRVVHGGALTKSVKIIASTLKKIRHASTLAPLHNPHNIAGIVAVQKRLPKIAQFAIFDTTFHTHVREKAGYALPLPYRKTYKRYGFHGISYAYICAQLRKTLRKFPQRLIVCHLGNGSSIAAIKNGKCIDTSMGFTPLEGLVMGSRTGDIDAGVVLDLCRKKGVSFVDTLLNKKSGLDGVSGKHDMRDIWQRAQKGDQKAQLAHALYCYRVQKYIGAYSAALGGLDCLVFTGGIGEHAHWVRKTICKDLGFLGISLDLKKNKKNVGNVSNGKVPVYVFHTNEEAMIALEVLAFIR